MPYKDKEKNKEYQREYQKNWKKKNPERWKEITKKSDSRPERKEYKNEWQRSSPKAEKIRERFKEKNPEYKKKYDRLWNKNNRDKVRLKNRKFYYTIKGVVNILKKKDKAKFGFVNKEINIDLVNFVNDRDKVCPYCGKDFKPRAEYDHINPFRCLSLKNIARVCSKCNQSKLNADLLAWMKFKRYEITKKVNDLYKEAYN